MPWHKDPNISFQNHGSQAKIVTGGKMFNNPRPIAFVLVSTNLGTIITNRNDYHMTDRIHGFGVGLQLFQTSDYERLEIDLALGVLAQRRIFFGDGVVALDCGANIGLHAIEWGRLMYGWGEVLAFEAQERIFYALAGNIAINNCMNVTARNVAIGSCCSQIQIPQPDYFTPASYGSFELRKGLSNEFIGQNIDYNKTKPISMISIDSLSLSRVDFIKIDVEGKETEVLLGGQKTIEQNHPVMLVEILKSKAEDIIQFLIGLGYKIFTIGANVLAIHKDDQTLKVLEGNLSR
jgi:FkbM family methyltransferase